MGASQSKAAAVSALAAAAARADIPTLEALLPDTPLAWLGAGDPADGWAALHFAAAAGAASPFPLSSSSADPSSEAIALLLSYGAAVTKPDKRGRTPLHVAAMTRNAPGARALLRSNSAAVVDARDRDGLTPLMAAAAVGGADVVRALIGAGANAKASLKVRVTMS
jgi:ankyrin repeat protein